MKSKPHELRLPASATRLMRAVAAGDLNAVRQALHYQGQKDEHGRTALMYAAQAGFASAVELLVRPPPRISGLRALFEEAPASELKMKDKTGETALHKAVRAASAPVVRILAPLEHSLRTASNLTALMLSAILDCPEAAAALAPHEALQENCGMTALMLAVRSLSYRAVPTLACWEAGVFVCRNAKFGPVAAFSQIQQFSAFEGVVSCQQILDQMNAEAPKSSALMEAAVLGDMLLVRFLINKEKGMQDPVSGETALMRCLDALSGKFSELSRADALDGRGIALQAAKLREVALFLADVKEEAGKVDKQGKTALMRACTCGEYGIDVARRLYSVEAVCVDANGLRCDDYSGYDALMRATLRRERPMLAE